MRLTDVQVDPRPIAAARIGLGVATVINAIEASAVLGAIADGNLARPVLGWIPTPTDSAVFIFLVAATVAGVATILGLGTRSAAAVTTVLNLGVLLWDEQTYSGHRVLATLLVAYLVFAKSDAAWSMSARGGRGRELVPWWPQLLMMMQLSVCYWFAAVSKVNPVFLSGDGLRNWVWWPLPDWVFPFMAVATILTELFLAVGLWLRRTRWTAAGVGICLHVSIVWMLRDPIPLIAFALACVPLFALFLWRPLSFPVGPMREPRSAEDNAIDPRQAAELRSPVRR